MLVGEREALVWGGLSLGSGKLLGICVVVLGSEQGPREEETPWLLWRPSQGGRGSSPVAAGKLKWRMASGGLVWALLLCPAVTSCEGQLQVWEGM